MRILMFWLENFKRIMLVVLLLLLINVITAYIVEQKFDDFTDYNLPNNMLLTYNSDIIGGMDSYQMTDYYAYQVEDVTTNVRGIDLSQIAYINDNSSAMKSYIQTQLNNGTKAIKQNVGLIGDSKFLNDNQINIPLRTLDFDHLVVGQYPAQNQILVSEEFATDIINSSSKFNSYQDLINTNYEDYTISGIYSASHLTLSDEIIKGAPKANNGELLVVTDYTQAMVEELVSSDEPYVTSDMFNSINIKVLAQITMFILSSLIFIVLMRKEVVTFKYVCKNNNVRPHLWVINVLLPILVISILVMVINLMI